MKRPRQLPLLRFTRARRRPQPAAPAPASPVRSAVRDVLQAPLDFSDRQPDVIYQLRPSPKKENQS